MARLEGTLMFSGPADDRFGEGGDWTGRKRLLFPPMLEKYPSLQRLHNQSSTETSGLGETITSSFSSQESIASIRSGTEIERVNGEGVVENNSDVVPVSQQMQRSFNNQTEIYGKEFTDTTRYLKPPSSSNPPQQASYGEEPDFDALFSQGEVAANIQVIDGYRKQTSDKEHESRSRCSSIKSRTSIGSFRSRSGSNRASRKFLGRNTESAWMKWSRERMASNRRRTALLEQPNPKEKERASTPIKKARQEGLVFIHPDLEAKYLCEEDIHHIQRHRQQRLATYNAIENSSRKSRFPQRLISNQTSEKDMEVLRHFWHHRLFVRSRYVSIILGIFTIIILIISICNKEWIIYPSENIRNRSNNEGLWSKCNPVLQNNMLLMVCSNLSGRDWQNAVIGMMVFALTFGTTAAVLAFCGVCTSPLPKKIYYFHSAGEIFLVSALCSCIALVIYPIAIEVDPTINNHTYGTGYGLGWGGTVFFFLASFCMSLDDLVRESSNAKCCRYCWKSSGNERTELQQV